MTFQLVRAVDSRYTIKYGVLQRVTSSTEVTSLVHDVQKRTAVVSHQLASFGIPNPGLLGRLRPDVIARLRTFVAEGEENRGDDSAIHVQVEKQSGGISHVSCLSQSHPALQLVVDEESGFLCRRIAAHDGAGKLAFSMA